MRLLVFAGQVSHLGEMTGSRHKSATAAFIRELRKALNPQ